MEKHGDDYVFLEKDLAYRSRGTGNTSSGSNAVSVALHNVNAQEMLLSIMPPLQPSGELVHTPCDIVLVIDVSGSMGCAAELPDQAGKAQKETSGLSVLDLVKHACRTILEKLTDHDRLAIVTFSTYAVVVQGLQYMTRQGKADTWAKIAKQKVHDSTNLWGGIREGLNILERSERVGNVQSMYILTDGAPNYMCPSQGYVRKLQPILTKMRVNNVTPTISCFGFGYYLRSDLLRSIAEVGRGTYAFIPDAGMIGTVFVHAIANLFATFATRVTVRLNCPNFAAQIILPSYYEFDCDDPVGNDRILRLGNLQYGQSRDIIIKVENCSLKDTLSATLRYTGPNRTIQTTLSPTTINFNVSSKLPKPILYYHLSRHELCTFLATLSTKNPNNEHVALPRSLVETRVPHLDALTTNLRDRMTSILKTDPTADLANMQSLLDDIAAPDVDSQHSGGQITLALRTTQTDLEPANNGDGPLPPPYRYRAPTPSYYMRWGQHYLPSILHAHMRQVCASFKDPGPLRYGVDSPLFIKTRDELDDAFDYLPPPTATLHRHAPGLSANGGPAPAVRMARYNYASNPCFTGDGDVRLWAEGGEEWTKVHSLAVGDLLWTPRGGRAIREIVRTDVSANGGQALVWIPGNHGLGKGLWITPFHPVHVAGRWVFPNDVEGGKKNMQKGDIYSILLERDQDSEAHVIQVGGVLCVALGHGLVGDCGIGDVRAHPFFGDYQRVLRGVELLARDDKGRRLCGGIRREWNGGTLVACEFLGFEKVVDRGEELRGADGNGQERQQSRACL